MPKKKASIKKQSKRNNSKKNKTSTVRKSKTSKTSKKNKVDNNLEKESEVVEATLVEETESSQEENQIQNTGLASFLPSFHQENNDEDSLEDFTIEEPRKDPWLKRALPYVFLVIVFILGIFIFFPLNDTVREGLLYLQSNGLPITVKKVDVGFLGGFDIRRVSYDASSKSLEAKVGHIEGGVSVFSLISGTLKLDALLERIVIEHKSYAKAVNGSLKITANIKNIMKNPAGFMGKVNITGKGFSVQAKDIPMVGDLRVVINKIKVNAKLAKGRATFAQGKNTISTNIAKIVFNGSTDLRKHGALSLKVKIILTEEFKSKKPGIYALLEQMKMLESNAIDITIGGTTSNPKTALKNAPSFPSMSSSKSGMSSSK